MSSTPVIFGKNLVVLAVTFGVVEAQIVAIVCAIRKAGIDQIEHKN